MALLRLFPTSDTTVYSDKPTLNTGADEQLELYSGSAVLIGFDTNRYRTLTGSLFLQLYLSEAYRLPEVVTLSIRAISSSWDAGLGKFEYYPSVTSSTNWNTKPSLYSTVVTHSIRQYDDKDLLIDVSALERGYGYYLSLESVVSGSTLFYFSKDTHTVYAPSLDLCWNDQVFAPTGSVLQSGSVVVSFKNSPYSLYHTGSHRISVNARPRYPERKFRSGSATSVYYLPSASYYGVRDAESGHWVIQPDPLYTRLSADRSGNYLKIYPEGLPENRYYTLEVFAPMLDELVHISDNYLFQVSD